MKTMKYFFATAFCVGMLMMRSNAAPADPDSTALPGANFSLEGALDLFRKAGSPAEFEKALNTDYNKVNNLDLNEDGTTDYIRVLNRKEDDVQIFVLQAVITASEYQDIAVIEVEKTGSESAVIQITGDEDIYGEETIVEPGDEGTAAYSFNALNNHGPKASFVDAETDSYTENGILSADVIIVNVWAWPSVRFVFAPGYRVWVSGWAWHARPRWWSPWRPLSWAAYRPFHHQYRHGYVVVPVRRIARGRAIYRPTRVTSVTVSNRNAVAVNHYRKTSVTKKSVTVNRNHKQVTATRKTTTVAGRHGTAKRTTTTVRRRR